MKAADVLAIAEGLEPGAATRQVAERQSQHE